jgi:hypothetical protein
LNELLPILSGLILGAILGWLHPRLRTRAAVAGSILLGVIATIASGESLISWAFLLIDIPTVFVSAGIAFAAAHWVRRAN